MTPDETTTHATTISGAPNLPGLSLTLLAMATFIVFPATAQDSPGALDLKTIMSDPDWIGRSPERPFWSDDGKTIYYWQKELGSAERRLHRIDRQGNPLGMVSDEEAGGLLDAPGGTYSIDRKQRLFVRHGDVFHKDLDAEVLTQITRTTSQERSPTFVGKQEIAYIRDGQVFVRDLETGLESQPFPHASADDPEEERKKEREKVDYLRDQQTRLFDWIRQQDEKKEQRTSRQLERQLADPTQPPPVTYLGKGNNVRRQLLSPLGNALLLVTNRSNPRDGKGAKMPRYVTGSGFTEIDDVRPKVGTKQTTDKVVLLLQDERELLEIKLAGLPGILDDPLADLRKAADERRKQAKGRNAGSGENRCPGRLSRTCRLCSKAGQEKDSEGPSEWRRQSGAPTASV